tara:strand:+ start:11394 stop:11798 length:405 start_codon:yes stop_codon:yes gene_type:complete
MLDIQLEQLENFTQQQKVNVCIQSINLLNVQLNNADLASVKTLAQSYMAGTTITITDKISALNTTIYARSRAVSDDDITYIDTAIDNAVSAYNSLATVLNDDKARHVINCMKAVISSQAAYTKHVTEASLKSLI